MFSKQELYAQMMRDFAKAAPLNWEGITGLIERFKGSHLLPSSLSEHEYLRLVARGTAFITFDYGVDGVSIEVAKYAQSLEDLYKNQDESAIHLIGGDFYPQADSVLKPDWHRFRIEGTNGWSKWDKGKWFNALFYEDMYEGSKVSNHLAREIFTQAATIAQKIGRYVVENDIYLLIPVNIASNPGNLALTIALVFVTEAMGLYVLNSNHDFFWDGGKPSSERKSGEVPGIRDHFFRNVDNEPFFNLLESLYPWNGQGWLQVNINRLQSETLIQRYHIPEDQVSELSTCLSDKFFEEYDKAAVTSARLRMAHILSGGEPFLRPTPLDKHIARLKEWMQHQVPCVLGRRPGLSVNPASDDLIVLLQPTRIIARKRIERNLELISALLTEGQFREEFEQNPHLQLVLHITGPTPKEHQQDLETVLLTYQKVLESLPESIADRVFMAFSVGNEDHPSFRTKNFEPLCIEEIYRMATAVVFPSQVEGRGLPIIESSACGVPIICSRYHPQEVFADVVGEGLPETQQIRYTLFPEGEFTAPFLEEVTGLIFHPERQRERFEHNKAVVRLRYSRESLTNRFKKLLEHLRALGG
jgi:glycosyltransferase involved in cell wall biosynthesis